MFAVTPQKRVIIKPEKSMSQAEREVQKKYGGADRVKVDLNKVQPNLRKNVKSANPLEFPNLSDLRISDSGIKVGPKAAYLGHLKSIFPSNVANGFVIPFAAYWAYFKDSEVKGKSGITLEDFTEETFDQYFSEPESSRSTNFITDRLRVIQESIRAIDLKNDSAFVEALKKSLEHNGLVAADGRTLNGVFLRSDTNVEDLPGFNGAGLNLTLFNLLTIDDVIEGIKDVWASPFEYRAFSWRQTKVSPPTFVFPSIVVLQTVASAKSGVLITADLDTEDPKVFTAATSEGIGGAVDGTSAEQIVISALPGSRQPVYQEIRLLDQFKSKVVKGQILYTIPANRLSFLRRLWRNL